jgi:transposase
MSEATDRAAKVLAVVTAAKPYMDERAALAVTLTAEDYSLRDVAEMLGLSHQTVANILARSASKG